jgi:ABC-2 type transport system permease protein
MRETLLIFRQEFLSTIRRVGFIILTLSLPLLALLAIGIFQIALHAAKPSPQVTKIGYVDLVGGFDQFTTQGNITLVGFPTESEATQALISKDIKEYFVIPPDFVPTGVVIRFVMQREFAPPLAITAAIENFMSSNLLAGKVSADVITRVESPVNLLTTTLTSSGGVAPQQGGYANFIIPGVFSVLLMLALIFTSTYVLQSLSEEKENRLIEILLSSVSSQQLLIGKVAGLGTAGLLQVLVWVACFPLLLNLASSSIGGILSTIHVPASFWVLGIMYFILGYLLFAVLSAAVAAVTSSVQEAQGLSAIYTTFAVSPLWFISLLMFFPNNPVWIIFSVFPFTAPVLTMLRLGITGVPAWQLALSLAVLAVSVVGGLLLASRLLRAYMLMYGKRPKLGEIIRSFRKA